jgi:uncharacterized membrane protein
MTQNPFEAPRARDAGYTPPSAVGTFDLGKTINDAWAACTRDLGLTVGVTIVGLIVYVVASFTVIGLFVIVPVLAWGGVKWLLNMQDGRPDFNDIFSGFKEYGAALGGMLMLMLLFVLPLVPGYAFAIGGAVAESVPPIVVGYLMIFVVMALVLVRFYFAPFFLVDQRMSAIDAMKASWEVTSEQKLNTFLLILVSGLIGSLGTMACFVGMLLTVPMQYVMIASAYRQLVGSTER